MDQLGTASAHDSRRSYDGSRAASGTEVEGQLAMFGIDDPLWLPTLLAALARGGCVLIERTGDLLILPAP